MNSNIFNYINRLNSNPHSPRQRLSRAYIVATTLASTYYERFEQNTIWLGRKIRSLTRSVISSVSDAVSHMIHNLCTERFFSRQPSEPTRHPQINAERISTNPSTPVLPQIKINKLPFKLEMDEFINSPPQYFKEIVSEIKNANTIELLSGRMDSLVDRHLEQAKDNRMMLHLIAYALFSGERKFSLAPISAICLLFVLNDPFSSNEDVLKLIKLTLQDRKNHFSLYGFKSSNEESKSPVVEKGVFKNSNEKVFINHGGGFFHILSFLNGSSEGYPAPSEYEGKGIFVYVGNANKTSFYANRMEINFDLPASLNGRLPANLLGKANVPNECVLRSDHVRKLQNVSIIPVPRRFEQIVPSKDSINSLPCESDLKERILVSIQRLRQMEVLGPYD